MTTSKVFSTTWPRTTTTFPTPVFDTTADNIWELLFTQEYFSDENYTDHLRVTNFDLATESPTFETVLEIENSTAAVKTINSPRNLNSVIDSLSESSAQRLQTSIIAILTIAFSVFIF